jgi:lysophospholipase L1-like esterase
LINILFSGCSYAYGAGLENNHHNSNHFSNIIANDLFGSNYYIHNIGISGYSNERIFLDSALSLTKNNYDYAFVCWTSLHRYVFWAGLETYECRRSFTPNNIFSDIAIEHNGNDISWSSKKLAELSADFLLLNHDHYYIKDLISYINILINIAEVKNTKIFFINNILPWDQNYFVHHQGVILPDMLTDYTNNLLNSNNRDDPQINELYHLMHKHYADNGGIQEKYWLNLYQSFFNLMIDFGNDHVHPGPKSHQMFADMLLKSINSHCGS